jgi:hypothetical protein
MTLLTLLIALIVIGIVVYFGFWMVDASGIPSPVNWLIKAIILLVGLLLLFKYGNIPGLTL